MRQMFGGGLMKLFYKRLWRIEQAANPDFVRYDAAETLKQAEMPVLLIYSADDPVVPLCHHRDVLAQALAGRDNVRFLIMAGRGHNPNYTADAAQYLASYTADLAAKRKAKALETPAQKKAFVDSWDWSRMTSQDNEVWRIILETLSR